MVYSTTVTALLSSYAFITPTNKIETKYLHGSRHFFSLSFSVARSVHVACMCIPTMARRGIQCSWGDIFSLFLWWRREKRKAITYTYTQKKNKAFTKATILFVEFFSAQRTHESFFYCGFSSCVEGSVFIHMQSDITSCSQKEEAISHGDCVVCVCVCASTKHGERKEKKTQKNDEKYLKICYVGFKWIYLC